MTPSEILNAAADRIRDLAAEATGGPWKHEFGVTQEDGSVNYAVDVAGDKAIAGVGEAWSAADAVWVAALSPAVAPHLESILRERADVLRWAKSWDEVADCGEMHLARAVLGKDTP
jgi:hypothetical protein